MLTATACFLLVSQAAAMESIVAHRVMESRLKLSHQFQDVDRMHTGHVSKNTFQRILSLVLRGPLSEDQLEALAAKHKGKTANDIDYTSFLTAVSTTQQTRTPLLLISPPRLNLTHTHTRRDVHLTCRAACLLVPRRWRRRRTAPSRPRRSRPRST